MDFSEVQKVIANVPLLSKELVGVALLMGIVCRILCASVAKFRGEHSLIIAGGLALLGAVAGLAAQHEPWPGITVQTAAMFVAVWGVDKALTKLIPDNSIGAAKAAEAPKP